MVTTAPEASSVSTEPIREPFQVNFRLRLLLPLTILVTRPLVAL